MIVTIGGIKGGSGKSTLACQLAVLAHHAGCETLLVDGDRQATASDFTNMRADTLGASGYTAIALDWKGMRDQLDALSRRFQLTLIDVGGADSMAQRQAWVKSDRVVAPFVPRSFDLWTVGQLVELRDEVLQVNPELRVITVLNRCQPRGRDNDAAAEQLASHDLEVLAVRIGDRKAFSDAGGFGLAVTEMRPVDPKACAEATMLLRECLDLSAVVPLTKGIIHGVDAA
jgi:chromosome partitioning protein